MICWRALCRHDHLNPPILMVGDQVDADTPVPRSRLLTRGHRRLMGQDLPHHAPPTRPDADYEPARVRFCR